MNAPNDETGSMPRFMRSWEEFWFKPADPTVLALMRIACGMIVVYTLFVYSFKLQDFMGPYAWFDLQSRMEIVRERPVRGPSLNWSIAGPLPKPVTPQQENYRSFYFKTFGVDPPPPYPVDEDEAVYLNEFRAQFNIDLRANGLKPSKKPEDRAYVVRYTLNHGVPPPAYVESEEEEKAIDEYRQNFGDDPRQVIAKGMPVFSLWFHILDPRTMAIVHGIIVGIAVLFTIGFCTRITSALLWFGSLCYIHRNPIVLFGVDTMMTILLLYLAIGPSGAVYSVDRLMRKWWVGAKPGIVLGWRRFWKLPLSGEVAPAAPVGDVPEPSVSANVAIRLLQIHVCIIYLAAGLSKLLGQTWWNGSAIWMTIANYEFAPMQYELYVNFLRFLGKYQLLHEAFLTGGGWFTLAFEIGYAFLIWRPKLRWVFLAAAILLHGGIGLLMGLKTFSLMMLVMNMVFLRPEEVNWLMERFSDPRLLLPGGAGK